MSWAKSLVRLSNHEVETLQKRLAEIVSRRAAVEMRIASLDAEVEAEAASKAPYEEAGFYLAGFREGAKVRRAQMLVDLADIEAEEAGARDALAEAFESLKKYEHVEEAQRLAAVKEAARRETATLDELGLRRRAR